MSGFLFGVGSVVTVGNAESLAASDVFSGAVGSVPL